MGFNLQRSLSRLFPQATFPLAAAWFSGTIRGGFRGERRRTGYPPRDIYSNEIYVEIVARRTVREWMLNLRAVPDQTEKEWCHPIPIVSQGT